MKQFEVMRQAQARAAAITFFIVAFGIVGRGLSAAPVVVVESAAMTAEQSLPRESAGSEHGLLIVDGEKLEFEIYYGAIPAGHASLEVQSDRTEDGEIYRITSAAQSNDAVSLFFDVDDRAVSEVDAATHEPDVSRSR